MALGGIGKRYAVALFNAAVAEDVLDQVHGDVTSFARLLESEPALDRFLTSLRVTAEEKKDLIVRAIGDRASGLFVKFVLLLIDKKRTAGFGDVARVFESLYEAHRQIVRVGVVTAIPLDPDLERKAKEMIERRTGKTAKIEKRVEPGIIGGMILFAGDQIIDGSIRNQLAELRSGLLETRVH
jgi:F-type H+-transporting ATPase subunit delta